MDIKGRNLKYEAPRAKARGFSNEILERMLKYKRILITAGPTWVPIDSVRVISNVATGKTGSLLAAQLQKLGAEVTLALGPVEAASVSKNIRLIRFRFFDELKNIIYQELKEKKYDMVIHSAAVSDYRMKKTYGRKISSDFKKLSLNLIPTPKILKLIKKVSKASVVVAFKFAPQASKQKLIAESKKLLRQRVCDLVVANTIKNGRYSAYIVSDNVRGPVQRKEKLARELLLSL